MISEVERHPPARTPTQWEVDIGFSRWISDLSHVAHRVLTVLLGALFVIPLLWMVGASVRQVGLAPPTQLEWIPNPVDLSNFLRIFDLLPLGSYLANSLKVVAVAVPVTIIAASWAGFAMSQIAPRPRSWLMALSVATLMVPVTALWLTRFFIYKWVGVLDTLWAVILPSFMGTSPFFVLLFYWTFTRIPKELYESGQLDGAGAFRVWATIAMPLARPAITAVGVLSFVFYWSNYIDPLLYLNDQRNYTLPLGLQSLQQMMPTNFPLLMAGALFITLPVIIMFVLAQRYFLQDARAVGLAVDEDKFTGTDTTDEGGEAKSTEARPGAEGSRTGQLAPPAGASTARLSLRRVGKHASNLLRLFLAINILSTLAATIMYRPDHNGYQGTHLFFMPRPNWDIDIPRDLVMVPDQYRGVDFASALAGLWSEHGRWLISQEPDLAAELEYRAAHSAYSDGDQYAQAEYALYEEYLLYQLYENHLDQEEFEPFGAHDDRAGDRVPREAVRRTQLATEASADQIPITVGQDLQVTDTGQQAQVQVPAMQPVIWRGNVLTPPPRI